MESFDKEEIARILRGFEEDLNVLQIKVGALESILLRDRETHAKYTQMVSEQAEALIRERANRQMHGPTEELPPGKPE